MAQVEIDDAELAALKAEIEQLRADRAARKARLKDDGGPPLTEPRAALLADGTTRVFTGAAPTHFSTDDPDGTERVVRVLSVHETE